jgi:3-oxoadipate enol-lactonase
MGWPTDYFTKARRTADVLNSLRVDFIDTALGVLRVRVIGSGEPILFWPSELMPSDMWSVQAEFFATHAAVILVDPPGHGGSQALKRNFSFAECAQSIADILDALKIDRVHLVGASWGGMIGVTFAATHPDRLNRAVLMNCTAAASDIEQKLQYNSIIGQARAMGRIRPPLTQSLMAAFLEPTTRSTRPEVVAQVRRSIEGVGVASAAWAMESVMRDRPDQRPLLRHVQSHVLVVAGNEDCPTPPAQAVEMVEGIAFSSLAVLDGVGHMASLEDPQAINILIEAFLFIRSE